MSLDAVLLGAYAFVSNVAIAVLPHEPVVIWYGARLGVGPTTLVATAGTLGAAWVDHRMFAALVTRLRGRPGAGEHDPAFVRWFARAPFAVLALSGLTPLPFFPFKALAFTMGYPLGRYLAAVAARSVPRYALLAWLGVLVELPAWLLALLFVALTIPALRAILWRPRNAS